MYLRKLELVGFKSFFNKTTLHFESGITAVVGPNGCGKSNIFDSIRWVLGEQSIKALRGSQMEDVIFNGTDSKEPLGMAEVALTFDNRKKILNIDRDEVVITRRIFRSRESEYLLNKTVVRLKDISDLLMGTGIGAESYSLVEQGKIDLVLSSRPEDRRLVFDEASGITKYKTQKKEAMRRLDETEQNLLRVNDIITEVKRQISSLERQANKARRYKEVFEELKSKEVKLALLQKGSLAADKEGLTNELRRFESEEVRLLEIIKDRETQINASDQEIKNLESSIANMKNQMLSSDNLIHRNKERVSFNRERINELDAARKHLQAQIEQTKARIILNEDKLSNIREEHERIKKNIEEKSSIQKNKEIELDKLDSLNKALLKNIAEAKKGILETASKITGIKNELSDLSSKQQIFLARKKRLEFEKAKVNEERGAIQDTLNSITQELGRIQEESAGLSLKISDSKTQLQQEESSLGQVNSEIEKLEKQKITLLSQKEFIEQLKTKYDDIGDSINATVYLDKLPDKELSGLVIKIKEIEAANLKLSGEAKPIDLDVQRIAEHISRIEEKINGFKNTRAAKEACIEEINRVIAGLQEDFRNQEIAAANKKTYQQTVAEQFTKINDEEDIIKVELSDVQKELSLLEERLAHTSSNLAESDKQQKQLEDTIADEQNNVSLNINLKEGIVVEIAQAKTEIDNLTKRLSSDEATLEILEDTYSQDKETLLNLESQITDAKNKQETLGAEIKDLEKQAEDAGLNLESQDSLLKEMEDKYRGALSSTSEITKSIGLQRKELDALKDKLYELQMQAKDLDFKILGIKERILQAYKIDLDTHESGALQQDAAPHGEVMQENDELLLGDISRLKEKLDSYGTVNLVAIEEYDELKKRYDFLTQQQNDLVTAKDSLHKAILKINHTARKMFLETFELVRQEFRNYFRLLFNGGDAKIFLIDEQDVLESGIEIICRPPGKKLQNVLLLSGGEKALSATALIFAVFKVKPTPFCVLDEIDAALDEANVDRFSRLLHDFASNSQFIVITHNKKTIANANVMYGITMEESGVSKIVSVKFAQSKAIEKDNEPAAAVAGPA